MTERKAKLARVLPSEEEEKKRSFLTMRMTRAMRTARMNFLEIFCAFLVPRRRRIHPFTRLTEINRLTVIRSILHNALLHLQYERNNSVFFYEKSSFVTYFVTSM